MGTLFYSSFIESKYSSFFALYTALERSPRNSACARSAYFVLRHARFHSRSRDFRVNTNQDREFKRFYYDLDHFHKTIKPCAFTQRIFKYRESFYSTYTIACAGLQSKVVQPSIQRFCQHFTTRLIPSYLSLYSCSEQWPSISLCLLNSQYLRYRMYSNP